MHWDSRLPDNTQEAKGGGGGEGVGLEWSACRETAIPSKQVKEKEREAKKKPQRRSSTCHFCQTLLVTAELCPVGWQAAFGAFHLAEVMGDEGSSSSHFKSVTIHPSVLVISGHCCAGQTPGKMCACCYEKTKGRADT